MKPLISRTLIFTVAITSTMFGLLVLLSPDSVHGLTVAVNRSIGTLDTVVRSQPSLSGALLLVVGISLCMLLLVE